ncbi:MAG: hypothetical protein U0L83_01050, partial [Muribaculaceae bacterium]|nr:hypothetical protein [Muribaculaceae bacterium]
HRISLALFVLFFSHVATATLLHHKTKITQRYATPALTNIGERGLIISELPKSANVLAKKEKRIAESEKAAVSTSEKLT